MFVLLPLIFFPNILILYTNAEGFPCNSTEESLLSLVNTILSAKELPPDLPRVAENSTNPEVCLTIQNSSSILTLRRFLYNRTTRTYGNDLQKRYFSTLYAYVEFKHTLLNSSRYVPKNHSDILILINAFSSSSISPMLGKKVYSYFSSYGNWTDTLVQNKFPFGSYKDPRSLLLGMLCALVNQSKHKLHEREALLFMFASNYNCHLDNSTDEMKWPIGEEINSDNQTKIKSNTNGSVYLIGLPMVEQVNGSATNLLRSNMGIINYSSQGEIRDKLPKIMFSASVLSSVGLKKAKDGGSNYNYSEKMKPNSTISKEETTTSTTDVAKTVTNTATAAHLLNSSSALLNIYETSTALTSSSNSTSSSPTQTNVDTSKLKSLEESVIFNSSSSPDDYFLQPNGSTDMLTIDIQDVGELDGLCKEGQQYLVKLEVQSLLTAVDKGVPKGSLELFRKLLPTIRQFPIQDYNARGELLRDLIPAISKQHADPLLKRKMNDILNHVILDGVGALPPKIKLECATITASELERFRRRTKRVFRIEYD